MVPSSLNPAPILSSGICRAPPEASVQLGGLHCGSSICGTEGAWEKNGKKSHRKKMKKNEKRWEKKWPRKELANVPCRGQKGVLLGWPCSSTGGCHLLQQTRMIWMIYLFLLSSNEIGPMMRGCDNVYIYFFGSVSSVHAWSFFTNPPRLLIHKNTASKLQCIYQNSPISPKLPNRSKSKGHQRVITSWDHWNTEIQVIWLSKFCECACTKQSTECVYSLVAWQLGDDLDVSQNFPGRKMAPGHTSLPSLPLAPGWWLPPWESQAWKASEMDADWQPNDASKWTELLF